MEDCAAQAGMVGAPAPRAAGGAPSRPRAVRRQGPRAQGPSCREANACSFRWTVERTATMRCSEPRSSDLAARLRPAILAWGLPLAAIVWSAYTKVAFRWIWPLAFAWMGTACLWNAARCRRVHCYFTGPLFLVAAALSALHGFG